MRGNRTAPCAVCGKPFLSWINAPRRCCSNACAGILRRGSHGSIVERLAAQTAVSDDHWIWQGRPNDTGYGRISLNGRLISTHMAAWIAVAGPIPKGMCVCHTCDIRLCLRNDEIGTYEVGGVLRPRREHLWLGTRAENLLDMRLKGRDANARVLRRRGEAHPHALLNDRKVRAIRLLWQTGEWTQHELGDVFGVTHHTIYRVVTGQSWRHVS
jgi:hypothetical protein